MVRIPLPPDWDPTAPNAPQLIVEPPPSHPASVGAPPSPSLWVVEVPAHIHPGGSFHASFDGVLMLVTHPGGPAATAGAAPSASTLPYPADGGVATPRHGGSLRVRGRGAALRQSGRGERDCANDSYDTYETDGSCSSAGAASSEVPLASDGAGGADEASGAGSVELELLRVLLEERKAAGGAAAELSEQVLLRLSAPEQGGVGRQQPSAEQQRQRRAEAEAERRARKQLRSIRRGQREQQRTAEREVSRRLALEKADIARQFGRQAGGATAGGSAATRRPVSQLYPLGLHPPVGPPCQDPADLPSTPSDAIPSEAVAARSASDAASAADRVAAGGAADRMNADSAIPSASHADSAIPPDSAAAAAAPLSHYPLEALPLGALPVEAPSQPPSLQPPGAQSLPVPTPDAELDGEGASPQSPQSPQSLSRSGLPPPSGAGQPEDAARERLPGAAASASGRGQVVSEGYRAADGPLAESSAAEDLPEDLEADLEADSAEDGGYGDSFVPPSASACSQTIPDEAVGGFSPGRSGRSIASVEEEEGMGFSPGRSIASVVEEEGMGFSPGRSFASVVEEEGLGGVASSAAEIESEAASEVYSAVPSVAEASEAEMITTDDESGSYSALAPQKGKLEALRAQLAVRREEARALLEEVGTNPNPKPIGLRVGANPNLDLSTHPNLEASQCESNHKPKARGFGVRAHL